MDNLYNDLTDCTSLTFKKLAGMTAKAEELKAQADRISEVNRMLVYLIQENKLHSIEDIDCAISWLEHSTLTPVEIINTIL